MSQISPPIRVVLMGAILLLAAWFTVLKPKEEVAVAPVTPTVASPGAPESAAGRFKAKAEDGRAKAEADATGAANAGLEGDTQTSGAPPTATDPTQSQSQSQTRSAPASARFAELAPIPPKAVAGLPRDVRGALRRRDVVVLGVLDDTGRPWAPMAEDDRLVRRALRTVNRYRGEVVVRSVPLERVSRYDALIGGLDVTQSPAVVVVDRNRRGVALTGYVDRVTINQAVADARRISTERRIGQAFLRETNQTCAMMNVAFTRLALPTARGAGSRWVARVGRAHRRYRRAFARTPAPKRHRSLKKQVVAAAKAREARHARAVKAKDAAGVLAASVAPQDRPFGGRKLERRFNQAGLTACAARRPR